MRDNNETNNKKKTNTQEMTYYFITVLALLAAAEALVWSPLFFRMPWLFAPKAWMAYKKVMHAGLELESEGQSHGMHAERYVTDDGRHSVAVFKSDDGDWSLGIFGNGSGEVLFSDVWRHHAGMLMERIDSLAAPHDGGHRQ